jgi:hypothetical protein
VHAIDLAFALGLIALLLAYGVEKHRSGKWGEMLFGCHVATALLAIGLLARTPWLIGAALVFHVGVGIPSWIVYAVGRGTTRTMEVLAHVLPSVAALPAAMRSGIPPGAALGAWAGFMGLSVVSYFATAPELNVNVVHRPSPELARFVRRPWAVRLILATTALFMLFAAEQVLAHVLGRPTAAPTTIPKSEPTWSVSP